MAKKSEEESSSPPSIRVAKNLAEKDDSAKAAEEVKSESKTVIEAQPNDSQTEATATKDDEAVNDGKNPTIRLAAKRNNKTEKPKEVSEKKSNTGHQLLAASVLTLLLLGNLYLYQWYALGNFNEEYLLSFSQDMIIKFLILVVIQTGIAAWVAISGILLRHPLVSAIPAVVGPLILVNLSDLNWIAQLPVLAFMIGSMLAMYEIKHSRDLYIKFNVTRLVGPYYGAILFGLALVIAIPVYLKLAAAPEILVDQINQKVTPVVLNVVEANLATEGEGSTVDAVMAILPTELQSLVDPSLVDETLSKQLDETIDKAAIQTQIEEQLLRLAQPLFPIIPFFFGLFTFLLFFQVSKWFGFFYNAIIWVVMQMLLGMGVAEIQSEEQSVEVVQLR